VRAETTPLKVRLMSGRRGPPSSTVEPSDEPQLHVPGGAFWVARWFVPQIATADTKLSCIVHGCVKPEILAVHAL
jgi:hypothetical protein